MLITARKENRRAKGLKLSEGGGETKAGKGG
jgi:hypothetical protein